MEPKLKNRPGTGLMTTGMVVILIAIAFQVTLTLFGNGNPGVMLTLMPIGLLLAAIGFGQRVLFALDNISPVAGYHPDRKPVTD